MPNNFLIRITNTFTTALNAAEVALPTEVVILLDNQFLKEEYFGDREMPRIVHHMLSDIAEIIRQRKKQLPNPFWQENTPKIIFVRPIPRPAYSLSDPEKYRYIKRKFCTELEEVTSQLKVSLANMDELNCSQRVLFDQFGNLSDYGIEQFWKSLSEYLRKSDRDEYHAVRRYRVPKKSVGMQTCTQEETKPKLPTSSVSVPGTLPNYQPNPPNFQQNWQNQQQNNENAVAYQNQFKYDYPPANDRFHYRRH